VHGQACLQRSLNVGDAVGKSKGNFLNSSRAGFANVIAANRDRVPIRHLTRAKHKSVGDEAQRRSRRVNVSAPRNVLLKNIVLQRALEFVETDMLLPGNGQIKTEQG